MWMVRYFSTTGLLESATVARGHFYVRSSVGKFVGFQSATISSINFGISNNKKRHRKSEAIIEQKNVWPETAIRAAELSTHSNIKLIKVNSKRTERQRHGADCGSRRKTALNQAINLLRRYRESLPRADRYKNTSVIKPLSKIQIPKSKRNAKRGAI